MLVYQRVAIENIGKTSIISIGSSSLGWSKALSLKHLGAARGCESRWGMENPGWNRLTLLILCLDVLCACCSFMKFLQLFVSFLGGINIYPLVFLHLPARWIPQPPRQKKRRPQRGRSECDQRQAISTCVRASRSSVSLDLGFDVTYVYIYIYVCVCVIVYIYNYIYCMYVCIHSIYRNVYVHI